MSTQGVMTLREYLAKTPNRKIDTHYGLLTAGELAHNCQLPAMDMPARRTLLAGGSRYTLAVASSNGDWYWVEKPF